LLAVFNILLRVVRASLPLTMLYVGKLIIDEIVLISVTAGGSAVENPDMSILTTFVLIELGLAVFSDLLGRGIALVDSLLGDLVSHEISLRLINQQGLILKVLKIQNFMTSLNVPDVRLQAESY